MSRDIVFRFSRSGSASYLSHLDLARAFRRALRRADIDVAATQGFNPHPIIKFARALPTGLDASDEAVLVRVAEAAPTLELAKRLSANLPSGLRLRSAAEAPGTLKSLLPVEASYRLSPAGELNPGDLEGLAAALGEASVDKRNKKGQLRTVPVAEFLSRPAELIDGELRFSLAFRNGATLKAGEVIGAACQAAGLDDSSMIESLVCDGLICQPDLR